MSGEMVRVKMLRSIAKQGEREWSVFNAGEVHAVPADVAQVWIDKGAAETAPEGGG